MVVQYVAEKLLYLKAGRKQRESERETERERERERERRMGQRKDTHKILPQVRGKSHLLQHYQQVPC
jgi:hypothetical protein